MGPVYRLTLRQLSGRWRLLITLLLTSLPVVMISIAVLIDEGDRVEHQGRFDDASGPEIAGELDDLVDPQRAEDIQSFEEFQAADDAENLAEFEDFVINGMLIGAILPLVVLAIASAAFANEVEDRTLANLTLSPIPRWKIVVPKLLAAITVAGPFIAVSAFATSYIGFDGEMLPTIAITTGAVVGVFLYASVFIWAGLMTSHAIGFGLLYVFMWEGLFAGLVNGVKFLSIRHYSIGLIHGIDEDRFASGDQLSFGIAIGTAVGVFVIFLALSIYRLRRMDVP